MSFTYGFYNSLNGDRKYDAIQFGQIFDGIINDGVFMSIGGKLMVTAASGMNVNVATGRAWFNSTWSFNDAIMLLEVPAAEVLLNRIDSVVLEVNATDTARTNSIKIIKGTPATNPVAPTLSNDAKLYQHPLANIYVGVGVTEITQANITNKVGTSDCPFVTGILETMDIDDLVSQWGTQWNEFMNKTDATTDGLIAEWTDEWETWIADTKSETSAFTQQQEAEFITWFNKMKGQLSEDAAGHLQNEIDEIKGTVTAMTMTASGWTSEGKYSFESLYPVATYNLFVALSGTCSEAQMTAWNKAQLLANPSANILIAGGVTPSIDIPVVLRAVKK